MNKHLLTLLTFYFVASTSFAQITIGTETNENQQAPIEAYFGYSYAQSIYLQSDISAAGTITTLSYFYSGTSDLSNSDDLVDIWIGHTMKADFANSTDWENITGLTQVFSGSIPAPTTPGVEEWLEIDITDFVYNNVDNLIIAIDANEDGFNSVNDDFHNSSTVGSQSISYRSDGTNPDPASPPSGTIVPYNPNIILGGIVQTCSPAEAGSAMNITSTSADIIWTDGIGCTTEATISFAPADDAGGVVSCGTQSYSASGLMSNTAYTVSVLNDCGASAYTFSFTTSLDYCAGDQFVDSGGPSNSYPSDANETWTICPDVGTDKVNVTFMEFEVEDNGAGTCYDQLKIFDGNDNTASQIGPAAGFCYDGSGTNGTGYPGGGLGIPIVSSHSTGCLTFEFTSDGSVQRTGWVAQVICAPYADPTNAVALTSAGTTTMTAANAMPGSNGFTYYEDPANTGNYLFAVDWNAAGNGRNDASNVTISVDNAPADGSMDNGTEATWTMKRFWNVDMGGGVILDPVNVKFFYDVADKTATEMAASSDGRPLETPSWFKTPDGEVWGNSPGAGNPVVGAIMLTDANGAGATENGVPFAQFDGIAAFSGGSFASGVGAAGQSALPLDLVSFTGTNKSSYNLLEWETQNEVNTSHFEIEFSVDGSVWKELGKESAAGLSSKSEFYSFADRTPASSTYYRLKMVDLDGTYEYSTFIRISRDTKDGEVVVYPNPVQDLLTVAFEATQDATMKYTIKDVNGRTMATKQTNIINGSNQFFVPTTELSPGIYFIDLNSATLNSVKKFIKQ